LYNVAANRGGVARAKALASQEARGSDNSLLVWALVAAILFSSILCVWSRAKVTSLGYEISNETRRLGELREMNEKLKAEVAMLKAPGRLEPIAREKLNLMPPENHQIVLMR
jgi:cell division protein FtsL